MTKTRDLQCTSENVEKGTTHISRTLKRSTRRGQSSSPYPRTHVTHGKLKTTQLTDVINNEQETPMDDVIPGTNIPPINRELRQSDVNPASPLRKPLVMSN